MHGGYTGWMVLVAIVVVLLYFLPTLLARIHRKSQFGSIFLVNLFFGWTVIGWLVAVFWASSRDAVSMAYVEPQPRTCSSCGSVIPTDAPVCPRCGKLLEKAA